MLAKQLIAAVFLLVLGLAWAQLDDPAVDKAFASLSPELQGKVDPDQVEELKNKSTQVFKEKCQKNGGPDAFANAERAFTDLKSCMESLVNRTVLEQEIEEAKPNGKIDEVFKNNAHGARLVAPALRLVRADQSAYVAGPAIYNRLPDAVRNAQSVHSFKTRYCGMKSQFKGCFKSAVDAAKPCFSGEEQRNLKTINNVTEQLAEFICFKDGDRIALFIAEGGPECFTEQQDAIQECVNGTMGPDVRLDPSHLSADSLPEINFGAKECAQLTKLQTCVVSNLEKCTQPTTANIAESLFKYIRKATPCKEFAETAQKQPDSASAVAVTSLTFIMAAATLLA